MKNLFFSLALGATALLFSNNASAQCGGPVFSDEPVRFTVNNQPAPYNVFRTGASYYVCSTGYLKAKFKATADYRPQIAGAWVLVNNQWQWATGTVTGTAPNYEAVINAPAGVNSNTIFDVFILGSHTFFSSNRVQHCPQSGRWTWEGRHTITRSSGVC